MKRKLLYRILLDLLLAALLMILLFPVVYMIISSFKSSGEIIMNRDFLPRKWTVENYVWILLKTNFGTYSVNSLYVAVVVTAITTTIAAMAGYALALYRNKSRFFGLFSKLLLLLQMFPGMLMVIPLYRSFSVMSMLNSRNTLIVLYGTFSLPFGIWLLSGFFEGFPKEVEESGRIDGCTKFQIFTRLVLPISSPGLASAAIFTFINAWNEYMIANIFIQSDMKKTLPLGLTNFILQFGSEWGNLMAASTITIIPVSIFLVFTQKYIVQGLTAGAVKG